MQKDKEEKLGEISLRVHRCFEILQIKDYEAIHKFLISDHHDSQTSIADLLSLKFNLSKADSDSFLTEVLHFPSSGTVK